MGIDDSPATLVGRPTLHPSGADPLVRASRPNVMYRGTWKNNPRTAAPGEDGLALLDCDRARSSCAPGHRPARIVAAIDCRAHPRPARPAGASRQRRTRCTGCRPGNSLAVCHRGRGRRLLALFAGARPRAAGAATADLAQGRPRPDESRSLEGVEKALTSRSTSPWTGTWTKRESPRVLPRTSRFNAVRPTSGVV